MRNYRHISPANWHMRKLLVILKGLRGTSTISAFLKLVILFIERSFKSASLSIFEGEDFGVQNLSSASDHEVPFAVMKLDEFVFSNICSGRVQDSALSLTESSHKISGERAISLGNNEFELLVPAFSLQKLRF